MTSASCNISRTFDWIYPSTLLISCHSFRFFLIMNSLRSLILVLIFWLISSVISDTIEDVVRLHNIARARHGAEPITWSERLARSAHKWANRCTFEHSNITHIGESFGYTSSPGGITAVIEKFYQEMQLYDDQKPGFSSETGHFTQLVWKSTKIVACAVSDRVCPHLGFQLWVCHYYPAGNNLHSFATQVAKGDLYYKPLIMDTASGNKKFSDQGLGSYKNLIIQCRARQDRAT